MFTYGFYNSKNGDRKYNATHFGKLFDGIITDGVFSSVYNQFRVVPVDNPDPTDPTVMIKSGAAWLGRTWNILDSDTEYSFSTVAANKQRTDAICIEVNQSDKSDEANNPSRTNRIVIVQGGVYGINDPISYPTLTYERNSLNNDVIRCQFPIAYVTIYGSIKKTDSVTYEANIIKEANIRNVVGVGSEDTKYKEWLPYVSGATMNIDVSSLIPAVEEFIGSLEQLRYNEQTEFNTWFDLMKGQLSEDAAGNLQNEIDTLITYGVNEPTELQEGQLYFQIEE